MTPEREEFGPVRIAWIDAAVTDPPSPDVLGPLGASQQRRYASLRGDAAHLFLVGRGLVVALIAELTDAADLGFTTRCERCGADHGRPRLERAPVAVSLSYAGSVVAVAVARHADAAAVGVDIERPPSEGAKVRLAELGPLFAAGTAPDTEGWTLIEAALKADGRGVTVDLVDIRIGGIGSGRLPASRAIGIPGRADSVDARVVPGPSGFVLSAAMIPAERHPL